MGEMIPVHAEGYGGDSPEAQQDIDLSNLYDQLEPETTDNPDEKEPDEDEISAEQKAIEGAASKLYWALGGAEKLLKKKYPYLVLEQQVDEDEEGQPVTMQMREMLASSYAPIAVDLGIGAGEPPEWAKKLLVYGAAALVTYECASVIREQVAYHKAKEVQEEPEGSQEQPKTEPEEEPSQEPIDPQVQREASVLQSAPIGG